MQPFVNPNYFQQTTQMPQMNYRYNPYQRMQQQEQMVPTQMSGANQQVLGINGRVVPAVENINTNEVPMDGSVAFFPKQDMSEIYAKSWGADGIIRTIVFKPYENDNANNFYHIKKKN